MGRSLGGIEILEETNGDRETNDDRLVLVLRNEDHL
jgi:hypothetical protein